MASVFAGPPSVAQSNDQIAHDPREPRIVPTRCKNLLGALSWMTKAAWVLSTPNNTATAKCRQASPNVTTLLPGLSTAQRIK